MPPLQDSPESLNPLAVLVSGGGHCASDSGRKPTLILRTSLGRSCDCPSPGPSGVLTTLRRCWQLSAKKQSIFSSHLYADDTEIHFSREMVSGALMVGVGSPDHPHLANESSTFNMAGEKVIAFPRLE